MSESIDLTAEEFIQTEIQKELLKIIDGSVKVPVTESGIEQLCGTVQKTLTRYLPTRKFIVRLAEDQKYTPEERRRLRIAPVIEIIEYTECINISVFVET